MPTPEEVVIAAIQRLGIPYEAIEIDPAFADTAGELLSTQRMQNDILHVDAFQKILAA